MVMGSYGGGRNLLIFSQLVSHIPNYLFVHGTFIGLFLHIRHVWTARGPRDPSKGLGRGAYGIK